MEKNYVRIKTENGDVIYILQYGKDSTVMFRLVFNSISNTYMGLTFDTFVDSVRGFLRVHPDYLNDTDCDDIPRWAKKNGYVERQPTRMEKLAYCKFEPNI